MNIWISMVFMVTMFFTNTFFCHDCLSVLVFSNEWSALSQVGLVLLIAVLTRTRCKAGRLRLGSLIKGSPSQTEKLTEGLPKLTEAIHLRKKLEKSMSFLQSWIFPGNKGRKMEGESAIVTGYLCGMCHAHAVPWRPRWLCLYWIQAGICLKGKDSRARVASMHAMQYQKEWRFSGVESWEAGAGDAKEQEEVTSCYWEMKKGPQNSWGADWGKWPLLGTALSLLERRPWRKWWQVRTRVRPCSPEGRNHLSQWMDIPWLTNGGRGWWWSLGLPPEKDGSTYLLSKSGVLWSVLLAQRPWRHPGYHHGRHQGDQRKLQSSRQEG